MTNRLETRLPHEPERNHQRDRKALAFSSRVESSGQGLLLGRTPIRETFALALELFANSTHSSAALRTHAIQNAGHHLWTHPVCT